MSLTTAYPYSLACLTQPLSLPHDAAHGLYRGDNLKEGDVLLSNHPASGGSHLPDMTVVTPVMAGGKRLFYVASRGHHADIGGISPGRYNSRTVPCTPFELHCAKFQGSMSRPPPDTRLRFDSIVGWPSWEAGHAKRSTVVLQSVTHGDQWSRRCDVCAVCPPFQRQSMRKELPSRRSSWWMLEYSRYQDILGRLLLPCGCPAGAIPGCIGISPKLGCLCDKHRGHSLASIFYVQEEGIRAILNERKPVLEEEGDDKGQQQRTIPGTRKIEDNMSDLRAQASS